MENLLKKIKNVARHIDSGLAEGRCAYRASLLFGVAVAASVALVEPGISYAEGITVAGVIYPEHGFFSSENK